MAHEQNSGLPPRNDSPADALIRKGLPADDAGWEHLPYRRRVLFAVHTLTGATRLLAVADLLTRDNDGVQVVFTQAPDVFGDGVEEFLKSIRAKCVRWEDVAKEHYDLTIAASCGKLHELQTPVILLPHGAGHHKLVGRRAGDGVPVKREVYGLDRQRLVHDGRVVPSVIVLSHREQEELLAASCPEALSCARVLGDPCYDQLVRALPARDDHRCALGVAGDSRLVVVSSTWGPHSLLWRRPELLRRLLDELPPSLYRVMAVFHPNEWVRQGEFQLRRRFAGALDKGLVLTPPDRGWQAAVTAADWVIGDQHGSVTLYATVSRATVLLGVLAPSEVAPGSPPERLPDVAPLLHDDRPLLPQLLESAACRRGYEAVASRITSCPGEFAANFRRLVHDMLGLPEPLSSPRLPPLTYP